ncbi:MAG: undecaprenyldiphospho-muramoylpentapeptide beta-N-acetylglucosaminyltransferase [Desulfovibrionales bacterium]
MMQRVVLTTGGTGGHIFPALAVAEELKLKHPDVDILFIGGNRGPEREIVQDAGIAFKALPAKGVLGKGIASALSLFWMTQSAFASYRTLRAFKPDVVAGFGGYAGFVPVWVARVMGIPTAIHEQNSFPGVTNRILGKRVNRVMLSFQDEHGFFDPRRTVVTGNPIRRSILQLRDQMERSSRPRQGRLLVLGGSQGASAINKAVTQSLPSFRSLGIKIWHQSGQADFEEVQNAYAREQACLERVDPFITNMAEAYAWADLVVCRAGASTISELTAVGMPSILIPFPYATHDHQLNNAKHLEAAGAALVLVQSYLEEVNLARAVGDLFSLPGKLQEMAKAARSQGKPQAAANIVNELERLAAIHQGKQKKGL